MSRKYEIKEGYGCRCLLKADTEEEIRVAFIEAEEGLYSVTCYEEDKEGDLIEVDDFLIAKHGCNSYGCSIYSLIMCDSSEGPAMFTAYLDEKGIYWSALRLTDNLFMSKLLGRKS